MNDMNNNMKPIAYESNDDVVIVYDETTDVMAMKNHYHSLFEIIYIIEGKAEFTINSKKYAVSPGNLVFISHLESHELKVTQYPYKRYYIIVKPHIVIACDPRLASILKYRPENFNHVIELHEKERDAVSGILSEINQESILKHDFYQTNMYALLELLLVHIYRKHNSAFPLTVISSSSEIILKIQKYIDGHYLEQISLKEVSGRFFINMYYLSHLFKKISGYTFKDYVILQRISKAKELLVQSEISILQVCMASGFCNINNFIRIFKKTEGLTPFQYRKAYRS